MLIWQGREKYLWIIVNWIPVIYKDLYLNVNWCELNRNQIQALAEILDSVLSWSSYHSATGKTDYSTDTNFNYYIYTFGVNLSLTEDSLTTVCSVDL